MCELMKWTFRGNEKLLVMSKRLLKVSTLL